MLISTFVSERTIFFVIYHKYDRHVTFRINSFTQSMGPETARTPCEETHTRESVTFPQLRLRTVIIHFDVYIMCCTIRIFFIAQGVLISFVLNMKTVENPNTYFNWK